MRKVVILAAALFGFIAAGAIAEGGKNCIRHQGDIGTGATEQHQVQVNK